MFTQEDILTAIEKAAKGHMRKNEVRRMLADKDRYAVTILADIADGTYLQKIAYRQLERTGSNGKRRKILSPSLYTRVLQIAWMNAVMPLYNARDKEGRANWLKCLIGYDEIESGLPTGKTVAREFHGNYSCLIQAIEA